MKEYAMALRFARIALIKLESIKDESADGYDLRREATALLREIVWMQDRSKTYLLQRSKQAENG